MKSSPVAGRTANVNGLRRPSAQMARYLPVVCGEERIVVGDGAVGIDPQDLALKRVEPLGRRLGGLLADADVELAVRAEVQRRRPDGRPGTLPPSVRWSSPASRIRSLPAAATSPSAVKRLMR